MKIGLTLAIVTYNRPIKLNRCINSVSKQTVLPDKVLVIDNDTNKTAKEVVSRYKSKLPITYLLESKKGTPHARNKALSENKSEFICFVDDDCTLDIFWVRNALKIIKKTKQKNPAFIVGKSKLLNKHNIYAQAQFATYRRWFVTQINQKDQLATPEALDTKNVILNFGVIKKHQLSFDTKYSEFNTSGFEDIDLGLQLTKLGYFGKYDPHLTISHEEVDNFKQMVHKAFQRGQLKYYLCQKWTSVDDLILNLNTQTSTGLFQRVKKICQSIIKTLKVLFKQNKSLKSKLATQRKIILMEIINQAFCQGFSYQEREGELKTKLAKKKER